MCVTFAYGWSIPVLCVLVLASAFAWGSFLLWLRGWLARPMTGSHLWRILSASLLWLMFCAVVAVVAHRDAPGWDDLVRSLIPLAIAVPAAVFAYSFPLRLALMRSFAEWRTAVLDLTRQVRGEFATDSAANIAFLEDVRSQALDLKGRIASCGPFPEVEEHLDGIAQAASVAVDSHVAALAFNNRAHEDTHLETRRDDAFRRRDTALVAIRDSAVRLQVIAAAMACP
jgi:hypothetical protein